MSLPSSWTQPDHDGRLTLFMRRNPDFLAIRWLLVLICWSTLQISSPISQVAIIFQLMQARRSGRASAATGDVAW